MVGHVNAVKEIPIIAIVDDDASVCRSLLRVVEAAGYRGETFASARQFLGWLSQGQAACVVLDVHMDELSGFDLHDRLKVPTILVTSLEDVATLDRLAKSGAAGHLRTPFDAASVLEAIHRAVGPAPAGPGAGLTAGVGAVDGHKSSVETGA
jgi:FixJ family two-component response regulator